MNSEKKELKPLIKSNNSDSSILASFLKEINTTLNKKDKNNPKFVKL